MGIDKHIAAELNRGKNEAASMSYFVLIVSILLAACQRPAAPQAGAPAAAAAPAPVPKASTVPKAPPSDPQLVSKEDDMRGITWYRSVNHERIIAAGQWTSVELYFGYFKNKGMGPLRVDATYHGPDWVFARRILIKVDDLPVFTLEAEDPAHKVSNGVWEMLDIPLGDEKLDLFCSPSMLAARVVKVRFDGREGYYDLTLPPNQLQDIQMMCQVYRSLAKAG